MGDEHTMSVMVTVHSKQVKCCVSLSPWQRRVVPCMQDAAGKQTHKEEACPSTPLARPHEPRCAGMRPGRLRFWLLHRACMTFH